MSRSGLISAFLLTLVTLSACTSGDATNDESNTSPALTTGGARKLRGTITYTGKRTTGTMKLALYRSLPAVGAPVAAAKYPAPKFPIQYEIDTPTGNYKLVGFLDVESDALGPNNGDPEIPNADVVIPETSDATLDVTFGD